MVITKEQKHDQNIPIWCCLEYIPSLWGKWHLQWVTMSWYHMPPRGYLEAILGMILASLQLEDKSISTRREGSCTPFPVLIFCGPSKQIFSHVLMLDFVKPGPVSHPCVR